MWTLFLFWSIFVSEHFVDSAGFVHVFSNFVKLDIIIIIMWDSSELLVLATVMLVLCLMIVWSLIDSMDEIQYRLVISGKRSAARIHRYQ